LGPGRPQFGKRIIADYVDFGWVYQPGGPIGCVTTTNELCTTVILDGVPVDGTTVTIERSYVDPTTHVVTYEAYTTCTTDVDGLCCVTIVESGGRSHNRPDG